MSPFHLAKPSSDAEQDSSQPKSLTDPIDPRGGLLIQIQEPNAIGPDDGVEREVTGVGELSRNASEVLELQRGCIRGVQGKLEVLNGFE